VSGHLLSVGGQVKVTGTNADGVRMHQQPSASSPTINILPETYLVSVLNGPFNDSDGNTFYRVEWAGQTGYVSSAYLIAASNKAVAGVGGWMRITNSDGDGIRFRSGPGTDSDVLGSVYEGEVLKLLAGPFSDSAGRHWYKLDHNGTVGYVDATYLGRTNSSTGTVINAAPKNTVQQVAPAAPAVKPAPPIVTASNGPLGQRIADISKQFLGYRYIWGSSDPTAGGFDCSGLVHYVLAQVGIGSGHSVDSDLAIGSAVSLGNLQPGDILIFANTYKAGPSHSGIYIGGGRFVHAETESTGVTISSLGDGYYASRFYAARRPGA
jgi:cell wall-associated NlpC family hydrolase